MKKNYKAISLLIGGVMLVGFSGYALAGSPTIEAGRGQTIESAAVTEPAAEPETPAEETAESTGTSGTILAGTEAAEEQGPAFPELAEEIPPIWGPVLSINEKTIMIDNQSGVSYSGEIVLNIDPEATRVLDAVNGFPVQLSDLKEGEIIYAYIGPAMTMSIPPMTTATTVICQIPQDFAVPSFLTVKSMEQQADESYVLTGTDGTVIQVPADCNILPYLTRNLVRLTDVEKGSQCLVWSGSDGHAEKIVLFPAE